MAALPMGNIGWKDIYESCKGGHNLLVTELYNMALVSYLQGCASMIIQVENIYVDKYAMHLALFEDRFEDAKKFADFILFYKNHQELRSCVEEKYKEYSFEEDEPGKK